MRDTLPWMGRSFRTLALLVTVAITRWEVYAATGETRAVLTNAAQILSQAFEPATNLFPAKIRGVVTYADEDWDIWYLQDETAGVYLNRSKKPMGLQAGMEVEVMGDARQGAFAPMLNTSSVRILGTNNLPNPKRVRFDETMGGAFDSQWVEMEGIIQYVRPDEGHLKLRFATPEEIYIYTPGYSNGPSQEILGLADARVRVRGVCSTKTTPDGNLLTSTLLVPSSEMIQIIEPPTADPFSLPRRPIASPSQYGNARRYGHRVKMAGTVTACDSPYVFFFQDETGGAFVHTRELHHYVPGDRIEVAAFPVPGGATPSMMDAFSRLIRHGPRPTPKPIDLSQGLQAGWDSFLISVEAQCVDAVPGEHGGSLIARVAGQNFDVFCDFPERDQTLNLNLRGARLVLTGIAAMDLNDQSQPEHFHMTISRADDIRVVAPAPWWTIRRILWMFGFVSVGLVGWGIQGLWREARLKEKYRLIVDNATDLISTHNQAGLFISWNGGWERVTGKTGQALGGVHLEELVEQGQVPGWRAWWAKLNAGETALPLELAITDPSGKKVWLEMVGRLGQDNHGKAQIESFTREVARRHQSEQMQAVQRKILEAIANNAALADILSQLILGVEEQSPGMIGSVLLLDPDGVTLHHGAAPSLPGEYNEIIDGLIMGEGVGSCGTAVARRARVVVPDIDIDPLWVNFRATTARFGLRACWATPIFSQSNLVLGTFAIYYREPREPTSEEIEIIEAARSLTSIAIERKRAEEELQSVTILQKAILDSADFSIVSVGIDGRVLSFNRGAERLLGWRAEEVVERFKISEFHVPQELETQAMKLATELHRPVAPDFEVFAAKARGGQAEKMEWTYVTKEGKHVPVLLSVTPLAGDRGRFAGFLCVASNLTGRKEEERQRSQLETQLRQSQKMQAMGTLAGGIAHDFNNILSSILGNAELLQLEIPDLPSLKQSVQGILKASERARNLVRHILSFSRAEKPERRPMSLRPVITETLQLLRASVPATTEIDAQVDESPLQILGNPTQIHQVLMNLGSNASQAIGGAPGRIHITARESVVSGHSNPRLRDGSHVMITVADNGCGMNAGTLERIFDPFFTTKAPGQGTGLGLSVVHGIVESHEGIIEVTSTPGHGTTFRLYFPTNHHVIAPTEEEETRVVPGAGQRVLIVDDETGIVSLITKMLARLGYQSIAYTNPLRALEQVEKSSIEFDLVMTDLTMPQMTGLEFAERVRVVRPDVPIILATGHHSGTHQAEFVRLGIRQILNKPFYAETMARAIQAALAQAPGAPGTPVPNDGE